MPVSKSFCPYYHSLRKVETFEKKILPTCGLCFEREGKKCKTATGSRLDRLCFLQIWNFHSLSSISFVLKFSGNIKTLGCETGMISEQSVTKNIDKNIVLCI